MEFFRVERLTEQTLFVLRFEVVVTFRVSRRRREMYCRHARLSVCVSVSGRMPTLLHGP